MRAQRRGIVQAAGGRRASRGFYTCAVMPIAPFTSPAQTPDYATLAARIRALARELGFQRCGIAGVELGEDEAHLRDWLAQGLYGSMD